jgi:hypothetical protein
MAHVISVGTGEAVGMAKNGDVGVTLVHARPSEDKFVAGGYGVYRRHPESLQTVICTKYFDGGVRCWPSRSRVFLRLPARSENTKQRLFLPTHNANNHVRNAARRVT